MLNENELTGERTMMLGAGLLFHSRTRTEILGHRNPFEGASIALKALTRPEDGSLTAGHWAR